MIQASRSQHFSNSFKLVFVECHYALRPTIDINSAVPCWIHSGYIPVGRFPDAQSLACIQPKANMKGLIICTLVDHRALVTRIRQHVTVTFPEVLS
jgi:hypothetical protein